MKLRIRGDFIRFRLTQSEVQQLHQEGKVEEKTHFPQKVFCYQIQTTKKNQIEAHFDAQSLCIFLPKEQVTHWATSNQVGINGEQVFDLHSKLKILVEKDFKCLTPRNSEEDEDTFPNPHKQHPNC